MNHLILLSGPIASGKTTIGIQLTKRINSQHRKAVFLDMDLEMANFTKEYSGEKLTHRKMWLVVRKKLAIKSKIFLENKIDVIVSGPFFYEKDIVCFRQYLTNEQILFLFTLNVSLEVRLKRNNCRLFKNSKKDLYEQMNRLLLKPSLYTYTTPINTYNQTSLDKTVSFIYKCIIKKH